MRSDFIKRIACFLIMSILAIEVGFTPYRAFAFSEDELSLKIETTSIEVKNAWQQLKNAAIIHLIAEKMYYCVSNYAIVRNVLDMSTGAGTPKSKKNVLSGDVFDTFAINMTFFTLKTGLKVSVPPVNAGPWLSDLFKDQKDGIINCAEQTKNGQNLFDLFVYVLKYKAGMSVYDLQNASVTQEDRLKVICDFENPTEPGLLTPTDGWGNRDYVTPCNDADNYTGVPVDEQLEYLGKLYNNMVENSNNEYLVKDFDTLRAYDEVDAFYLYSKDFEMQCSKANEDFTPGATTTDSENFFGYKIDDESGLVQEGTYEILNDTARQSFFGDKTRTCSNLIQMMNERIGRYLKKVNSEVYKACKTGVDVAIQEKRQEINEKYLDNETASKAEKEDAELVLNEYTRIETTKEYVATYGKNNSETLYNTGNGVPASEAEYEMPTDYVWTCRAHLPYIDVTIQDEADLSEAIREEFYDACYEAVDLAWVVCPIINGLTGITDELNTLIEDFF